MAPIWTKNGPFWTNMAQGIPGNSHEVKIGLMPIKYIQADHLVIIDSGQWTAFTILAMFFENTPLRDHCVFAELQLFGFWDVE